MSKRIKRVISEFSADAVLKYGYASSPYGEMLVAMSDGEVCFLTFTCEDRRVAKAELEDFWTGARFHEDRAQAEEIAGRLFSDDPIALCVKGTDFQVKVWEALLSVPVGKTVSYSQLAAMAGYPKAVRAVASAVARNPVPVIIPCHRIVRKSGEVGKFRYGTPMKQSMLNDEKVKISALV